MNILLTGSNGFLGNIIKKELFFKIPKMKINGDIGKMFQKCLIK